MSSPANVSVNSVLWFGSKKKEAAQATVQETQAKPKPKKLKGQAVAKYEITGEKVKFSNTKGLFKKSWVVEKEFTIYEITSLECVGNWLSLTWNSTLYQFKLKRKGESFDKLNEQIQTLQADHQKAKELNDKVAQRKTDLLGLIDRSLPIVDSSFDILMGLHAKRVDWQQVEADAQTLGSAFSYTPSTLPAINLDFTKISTAVRDQVVKDTSKEALALLKSMHDYFTGLKSEDDLVTFSPNFEQVKASLMAYYTLNDLMLAKVVGEKDSKKEVAYLEETVKSLEGTNVKVDAAALLGIIDSVVLEADRSSAIFDARALFREQLKQL